LRRSPTGSYSLELPDSIRDDVDGRVSSFWIEGEPLLLQVSSYQRLDGPTLAAEVRLQERMRQQGGTWTTIPVDSLPETNADKAGGEQFVGGLLWLHIYLVWPHLTIYVTLSGPPDQVQNRNSWARSAINSLSLIIQ
jgi:hypothetical protein